MVILSSQWDRKEYYEQQAQQLRRQSAEALGMGDLNEAKRLSELAIQSEQKARGIENQIRRSMEG